MAVLSDNLRGAAFMVGAMCAYTFNDAFMKSLSSELPLFQAVFLRGTGAVVALAIMCYLMGQFRFRFSRRDWQLAAVRTASEVAGTYFFLNALFHMPIANVSAILQALPLSVSLAAAVFFQEPLGWRRLSAIAVGFVGVVLIIQPGGADFSIYSLYAVATVACVTLRDLAARRMSHDVPSVFVALLTAAGVTAFGATGAIFTQWAPVSVTTGLQLAGATSALIFGYIASVSAMRVGEVSFVAPFRYTSLLVAIILGMIIFDEFPNSLTVAGTVLVVCTGLFTLCREARLRRKT